MSKKATWFWVTVMSVVLCVSIFIGRTKAQDVVTVCRDTDIAENMFLFTIPEEWNNPDLASWTALGAGYEMIDATTIRVQALEEWGVYGEGQPEWILAVKVGQALVTSGDYSVIVTGDANTRPCNRPVDAPPKAATCPSIAIDGVTGKPYCYEPLANGLVPIPPAH